jgi:hypothetical protein
MKINNKKAIVPLALLLVLTLMPLVMADENLTVGVIVEAVPPIPITAQVIMATGLGFPILLLLLKMFQVKNFKDMMLIIITAMVCVSIVGIIVGLF